VGYNSSSESFNHLNKSVCDAICKIGYAHVLSECVSVTTPHSVLGGAEAWLGREFMNSVVVQLAQSALATKSDSNNTLFPTSVLSHVKVQ
jgi:hypothetical protein